MRPPRTLLVPFELGRPLGLPNDARLQSDVLLSALRLCKRTDVPVIESYDCEPDRYQSDSDLSAWACPVHFDAETEVSQVISELRLLRPWYQRSLGQRGNTAVGLSDLDIEDCVNMLLSLLDGTLIKAPEDLDTADFIKAMVEDLKTYYFEATVVQPGHPDGLALRKWFWHETMAGRLLKDLREKLKDSEDEKLSILAKMTFVPEEQLGDD